MLCNCSSLNKEFQLKSKKFIAFYMVSESFKPTRKGGKQSNKYSRVTKKNLRKWFTCNWRHNQETQKQSTYSLKYRLETKKVYKRLRQSMQV